MSNSTKEQTILILPDGPISHEAGLYKYSKGERLYIDNLAKDFKEVQIATFVLREGDEFYESNLHSSFSSINIRVIELPAPKTKNPSVIQKAFQFLKVFFVIARVTKKVDVSYLFLPSYPSAFGFLASKIYGKPHIVYGADDWVTASESMFRWEKDRSSLFYRAYAALNKHMEIAIVRSALFGVAAGGQLIEKYRNLGCTTYPTTPRMTLTRSDIFNRTDTCAGDVIQLVNVGGLIHDKAQHQLLKAFSLALEKEGRLRLKIIGEGPERDSLMSLAISLGVTDKVEFTGYIESEALLYSHLKAADIFVLSSVTEGFPRVLYEAMCMRLPIISTRVGGIPYLMSDRENALLVDCGDNNALADAIHTLTSSGELRKTVIMNASKTLDKVFDYMDGGQISKLLTRHSI